MRAIFNEANRMAEYLGLRSPVARIDVLNRQLYEGHARFLPTSGNQLEIEWHGVNATGRDKRELVENWITMTKRQIEQVGA